MDVQTHVTRSSTTQPRDKSERRTTGREARVPQPSWQTLHVKRSSGRVSCRKNIICTPGFAKE